MFSCICVYIVEIFHLHSNFLKKGVIEMKFLWKLAKYNGVIIVVVIGICLMAGIFDGYSVGKFLVGLLLFLVIIGPPIFLERGSYRGNKQSK